MTFSPLALILIPTGYLFLWPLADRLLRSREEPPGPLEVALTALALSVGGLTWLLFWAGLLPGQWLMPLLALLIVLVGLAVGLVLNRAWISPARWRAYWAAQWRRLARLEMDGLLTWALVAVGFIMLIHALYYPFIGDDVLSRYGLQAQQIYWARRIPESVSGYPPLAPLSFVATWFAAGQPNEHLARLFPIAMACGMLGATYLVGRRVLDRQGGLLAAVLVALTPTFIRYGTLAYTDIPTTFPLTLATLYVLRWWESGRARDAVLAGALVAIGLFTKQSALTWLPSLAVIPPLWLLASRREVLPNRWHRAGVGLAGFLVPAVLITGPWYVRNVVLDGWENVLPVAGLYHIRADGAGWLGILPPLSRPGDFGPALRWLYALGWVAGLASAARQGWQALRGESTGPPADLIFSALAVPYWLAWWVKFSYDGRFLVLILPLIALWTARLLRWVIGWIGEHTNFPRLLWQVGGGLLLAGLVIWGARDRLGGVYNAVTRPFASDAERLLHAKGSLYDLVLYIRENFDPQQDRLLLMDGRMVYYLSDYNISSFYPLTLAELEGYDYLVHSSSIYSVYNKRLGWADSEFYRYSQDPLIFEPVYVSEGVHVMRILRTDIPTREEYEVYRQRRRQQKEKR